MVNKRLSGSRFRFALLGLCAGLVLAACSLFTGPAVETPAGPHPVDTPSPVPSSDWPTDAPTNITLTPRVSTPTAPPALPITLDNAARLTYTPITLAEYPARLLLVGKDVRVPGMIGLIPDLVVFTGSNLVPVYFDMVEYGPLRPFNIQGELLDFAPDLSSMVVRDDAWQGRILDLSGGLLHTLSEPAVNTARYAPDGRLIAVTSQSEFAATLYDVSTGEQVARLTGFETAAPVYGVVPAPGGKTIAWHARATLVLQDVASGQIKHTFSFQDFITNFAFSPDGARIVIVVENKLKLFTVPDAQLLAEIDLSQGVASLAWSPDGRLLAAGYGPGLQIWDAATLAPLANLPGPNAFTGQVIFSPDGRRLVTTHEENTIAVWRVGE